MKEADFSSLIGNEPVKHYLTRIIARQAIAHAFLFAGPPGVGKERFAHAFAAQLLCAEDPTGLHRQKILSGNHPDLHFYRPEGKLGLHSLQALRYLSDEVHLPPYEAKWKVFIIDDAERMLTYSANALLKTFEEPPPQTVIILVSHQPQALLATILSRCRTVYFQALSNQEISHYLQSHYALEAEQAQTMAFLARGSLGQAVRLIEKGQANHRVHLLTLLSKGPMSTYKILSESAQHLADQIEASKKQYEEEAKNELYKVPVEYLSAYQQQILEKELEGTVALSVIQEARSILLTILSWYRDLHLIAIKGPRYLLMNPDYQEQLEQAVQRGELLKLEDVQKAVDEADLALQRSTALNLCLENLFLKLQLL